MEEVNKEIFKIENLNLYYGEKHEPRRNFDFQRGCCHHVFKFRYPHDIPVYFAESAINLVA